MRKRERLAGSKAYRLRFEAEKPKPPSVLRHTESAADALSDLKKRMENIGYRVTIARGDHRSFPDGEAALTRKKGEHDPCTTPNP